MYVRNESASTETKDVSNMGVTVGENFLCNVLNLASSTLSKVIAAACGVAISI